MTCSCGYHFVFNPKQDRVSDGKFAAAIAQAGRNGTYVFTKNQLHTAFCRKLKQKTGCFLVLLIIAVAAAIFGLAVGITGLGIPALFVALVSFLLFMQANKNPNTARPRFDSLLSRWLSRLNIPNLVQEPAMHQPPPDWPEQDIYDYGAEKILIVQHDLLVDLFVRNNFHSEQACLVVSVNHYPQYIWQRAESILRSQNLTSVFMLHDATTQGLRASERFQAAHAPLLGQNRVLDLGLFPGDADKMPALSACHLKKESMDVPVDIIPYAHLQGLMAQSMQDGVPFRTVLAYRKDSGFDSDSGGSYG